MPELMPLHPLILAGFIGFLASLSALAVFAMLRTPRRQAPSLAGRLQFEGRALVASDGKAGRAFADSEPSGDDWDRAVALLEPYFPALDPRRPPGTLDDGTLRSPVTGAALEIRRDGSIVTLSIGTAAPEETPAETPRADQPADSAAFRSATHLLPFPVWMQDAEGRLCWANATYLALSADLSPEARPDIWPPPAVFDPALLPTPTREGTSARVPTSPGGSAPRHWFEVHARLDGDRTLFAAANADDAVRADRSLKDFRRTLTTTFAQLTVGLAVFDPSRRLVMFNPALVDMTGLAPDVLAARPTLVGFLDRLRERRIIPEPKDYGSWRRKMAELETAASNGTYAETWSLPGGETYRVTGQPHSDGAVIFLFEDISAEISLTRRFRAELEMGQAVIDSLDDAIAVFTPDGILAMTNAAYTVLWDHDPETELSRMSVADATAIWLTRCAPTPVWGDFRDFVHQSRNRVDWSADVMLRDGRRFVCRVSPLAGGGTLARFEPRFPGSLRAEPDHRQTA